MNKRILKTILAYLILPGILVIYGIGPAHAVNHQELVLKANKAYGAGDFTKAAEIYKSVVDAGFESSYLYYNLGNAYYKLQDYPNAILFYERARKLDPGNEDIDFNLNVANTKISDKIEPVPELFYKRWIKGLVLFFPVDTWALLAVLLLGIAMTGFVLYLVTRILLLRKAGFWAGVVLFVASLFCLVFSWSGNRYLMSNETGIIFTPTVTVKSSPDENSTDLFVVHEGTKVLLLDNINGWYEIKIANGSVGWLPNSTLVRI